MILTVIGIVLYKAVEIAEWGFMRWRYGAGWDQKEYQCQSS